MTALEILIDARARIANVFHWTTGAYSRDMNDSPLRLDSSRRTEAVSWCALGSVRLSIPEPITESHLFATGMALTMYELLNDIATKRYGRDIHEVNDCIGHAAIIAIYDEAIRQLQPVEAPVAAQVEKTVTMEPATIVAV